MAAPFQIRKETLKQVRTTFLKMSSAEWDLALMNKSDEEKKKADIEYARLQRARLRLGNAELAKIRNNLLKNEQDLEKGRVHVAKALQNLKDVKAVLGTVSSFLDVIGRVVALV